MTDLLLRRIAAFFDENDTAGAFLAEDGDGGYVAAVARMTRELERLRAAVSDHYGVVVSDSGPLASKRVNRSLEALRLAALPSLKEVNPDDG